jgi:hypothetical protein
VAIGVLELKFAFDHCLDFSDLSGEEVNSVLTHRAGHSEILVFFQ